ncbi:MAG: class I SAM-dependent methyltransferase [Candidatus Liptonbacteria bacterium]|nr:class I SAM-dependent methyltransferase [Parcubacteria group bacterium]MBI4087341.1 class I SAM-dependent methyltransferase [Candidatus Liptonbacteria bacterium]
MPKITTCRICESPKLKPFFDLGEQPLANSLLDGSQESGVRSQGEKFYPLSLTWCENCNLVQLEETVDSKGLFSTYVWVTGTSKGANEFSRKFYSELVRRVGGDKSGYVLEIASNDGTFLKQFIEDGYEVLGVDPARNIAEMAERAGVPTKCVFWGKPAAEDLVAEKGRARIVFARNVLPHVANTRDFVEGLARALAEDGTLAIEAHYAKIILEELHYDSIYHEHLCYFTLKTLEKLLNDFGLYVFDIAKSPISGGSVVVYARKESGVRSQESGINESEMLKSFREKETEDGINNLERWQGFARRSFEHRDKLLEILGEAKKFGRIIGWGASARSSTLLNFCGIDSSIISSIIDLNPLKQGKFTAGTHIPIVKPEEALKETPALVFITGWNFADEIIDSLRNKFGYKGPCLVPLPKEPRVISH